MPIVGWSSGIAELTSFGYAPPSLPVSSAAFLFMAAGLALLLRDARPWLAWLLLAVPVAIGIARLVSPPSAELGIDGWLFGDAVRRAVATQAATPGIVHALMLITLPIAMIAAQARTARAAMVSVALAGTALAFATLSLLLVPHADAVHASGWRILASSLPAAMATMLLSLAVLAWLSDRPGSRTEWRRFGLVIPLLMVEPVTASLLEFAGIETGWERPLSGVLMSVGLNFVAIASLLAWSIRSAQRHRAALQEITYALDAAPLALVDSDDRIIHWSRGCEALYGWSAAEAVGRRKHELLQAQEYGLARMQGDASDPSERELTEVRRDGVTVHVIEQAHTMVKAGRGPMTVLSMTDIGDRLKAETALRESEHRLALAASAHEMGLFEWDVASDKLTWTPGSEQRLGLEPGTLHDYDSWAAMVEPDDLAEIRRTVGAAVASQYDRFSLKYRLKQRDGVARTIEGSARFFYDANGGLIRTLGINLDITRHEAREAALRAREEQWRSILETVPDAMIVIDGKGQISSFSAAAERLFGYSAAEVIGKNVSMLVPGDHGASHDSYLARYHDTGERRVIGHRRLLVAKRASGQEFPVEIHVGEAWVGGERLFTGFVRDITERVAAQERLNIVHQELKHVSRVNAVGEMAAALAHELNQPLSAVANFVVGAELLTRVGGESERVGDMLRQANAQTQRAGEIIRRVRAFIAKRENEMHVEPVEDTVREAATLLIAVQKQYHAHLTFAIDPAADFMLADRIQVQQVLVNLLRNAFEALVNMPVERREVVIGARRLQDQIEISVTDRGPGLSDAIRETLFTPFTSSKGEGSMGIGLSICRRIIEAHGGHLIADSAPHGGACFRFTVMRRDQDLGMG